MFWAVYKFENQKIIKVNFIIKKGILRVVGSEGKLQSNLSDMNIAAVGPYWHKVCSTTFQGDKK